MFEVSEIDLYHQGSQDARQELGETLAELLEPIAWRRIVDAADGRTHHDRCYEHHIDCLAYRVLTITGVEIPPWLEGAARPE